MIDEAKYSTTLIFSPCVSLKMFLNENKNSGDWWAPAKDISSIPKYNEYPSIYERGVTIYG